jgi:hypothetical protein
MNDTTRAVEGDHKAAGQYVQAYWENADAYIVADVNPDPAAELQDTEAELPEAQI